MSTTARRARKRAGIKFNKDAKVGTPIAERSSFSALVYGPKGTPREQVLTTRSWRRRVDVLKARGLPLTADMEAELDDSLVRALGPVDAEQAVEPGFTVVASGTMP